MGKIKVVEQKMGRVGGSSCSTDRAGISENISEADDV